MSPFSSFFFTSPPPCPQILIFRQHMLPQKELLSFRFALPLCSARHISASRLLPPPPLTSTPPDAFCVDVATEQMPFLRARRRLCRTSADNAAVLRRRHCAENRGKRGVFQGVDRTDTVLDRRRSSHAMLLPFLPGVFGWLSLTVRAPELLQCHASHPPLATEPRHAIESYSSDSLTLPG